MENLQKFWCHPEFPAIGTDEKIIVRHGIGAQDVGVRDYERELNHRHLQHHACEKYTDSPAETILTYESNDPEFQPEFCAFQL